MNTLRQISKSLLRLRQAMLLIVMIMMCGVSEVMAIDQVDGVYQISSAADLKEFADIVNGTNGKTSNVKAKATVTKDITLSGEFPMIGVYNSKKYAGTFNGGGHSISGLQITIDGAKTGIGFFACTSGATIKDFKLSGDVIINNGTGSTFFISSLVGFAESNTKLEDVTSSVNITFNGGTGGDSGVRIIGGLATRFNGTINRCRYNGTIDASSNASNIGDRVAGICANPNGVTISNSLFDGTIKTNCTSTPHIVGGIAGQINSGTNTIEKCLSVGTFTFASGAKTDNCGAIYGVKNSCTNCYYINSYGAGVTSGSTATAVGSTPWADITNTLNNNAVVGETANWKIVEGKDYPIPMSYTIEAAGPYTITFDTKGGTPIAPIEAAYGAEIEAPSNPTKTGYVFAGWDKEIPSTMPGANITITAKWTYTPVDGNYLISTKEDFFNFATVVSTNPAACAKLIDNVDLENTEFAGFGKNETSKFYTGTFDGQGHTIRNFTRTCTTSNGCGFFNAINNATVKDFTLEGNITFNFSNEQYYNSSVVAYMTGTSKIEDVHSKVNATMTNGKTRLYGGILGRGTGTVNRCRYSGTVNANTSYDQIAGICASSNGGLTISNCLFDGSITSESTSASLCMGGIVAKTNQDNNTLSNNLVKGTISPSSNTYAMCGVVIGNASHSISMDRCYYVGVGSLPAVGTPTKSTGTATLVDPSADGFKWLDICVALNNGSTNWGIQTETYPVPGDKAAQNYTITFNTNGGTPETMDPIVQPEGSAITAPTPPTKTGYDFAGWRPELPATMPKDGLSVTAQWSLANFNVNYYVDGKLYKTVPVQYTSTIEPLTVPTKDRYTFSGWSGFPEDNKMPAEDVRIDGTFTFSPNAETGIFEIGNQEDLFNFAAYVNSGTGTGNGHGNANAKLLKDIELDGTTPFPGLGKYVTYREGETNVFDPSYAYTGTFDGQGYSITGLVRNVTSGNYGGLFNYVKDAKIKKFSLTGNMTVSANNQQYGSVVGGAEGTTLIEDVHSSVNINVTNTAAQLGGFAGRIGGTINRCSYSGTIISDKAFNKVGGFIGSLRAGSLTNCLFDGTLTLTVDNSGLIAGGLAGAAIEATPNKIENCLMNGTVNITNKTASCGRVIGYFDVDLNMQKVCYTKPNDATITDAVGTAKKSATGSKAIDVTSESWTTVTNILNPSEGTVGNWEIKAGKDWPVPSACTITAHEHSYNSNGFCIADDGAYEPATKAMDGRYEVSNAGQLWWMASQLNGKDSALPKTTRIRLTADIDMEGDSHGQFPGICPLGRIGDVDDWEGTAFQGTFDGNNHTISNYGRTISVGTTRSGIINAAYNATIRKINICGTVTVTVNGAEAVMIGTIVGSAAGTSSVEDINSSVSLVVNNGNVRDFGGVAGALEDKTSKARVTMNRCRYSGTITLNDGTSSNRKAENVGGLVGELRSAVIKNCLFDGTITAAAGANYSSVGGVVGKVGTNDNSEMHRILSHGTITLNGYTAATNKSGIVVGSADKTIYLYKNYHTKTNVTNGLDYIGPHTAIKSVTNEDTGVKSDTEVDQLLGKSTDMSSSLADLYSEDFRTLLGEPNWAQVEKTEGKYTYPLKDENHEHKYRNGFCTSGDGAYDVPNRMGKIYQIQNAGELFWFAEHFNDPDSDIPQDAEVQILRDIDMEKDAYIYPGIGTVNKPFKGVFNGMSHVISGYYRDIFNSERTGLINNAEDATIEFFTLRGETHYNLASIKSYHGSVVGMAIGKNTLITDVFSYVDLCSHNAYTRVLGGIAGRSSGKLIRSRYSGTIAKITKTINEEEGTVTRTEEPMAAGRQIGGIIANAREEILISDCLFDGKILSTCQESPTMRVSGILASNEKDSGVKITIKNCLFNGCLQLNHTYEKGRDGSDEKSTQNGIIAGYWDSNLPKFVNNVYYLKTCDGMEDINIGEWEGKKQQEGSTMATTEIKEPKEGETSDIWDTEHNQPDWNKIFQELDEYHVVTDAEGNPVVDKDGNQVTERNGNWEYNVVEQQGGESVEEVVPGGHVCHHKKEDGTDAYDKYGYCTICGAARPLKYDTDPDGTKRYKMEVVSDLASFRDMVNDGDLTAGTVLNAKLTDDIDFEDYEGEFGKPIGNSNFNRYLYNFDGQGHKLLNVKIKTDDQFVGFFGFAGDETHDCEIHDFTITGTVEASYDSKTNDDKPLYIGVVGKMYRGKVYNVHSELTMTNTSPTRAVLGGIIGCIDTPVGNDGDGNPLKVVIDKCSYTGTCYANAAGDMGGILGQSSRYTEVKNCTFAGNMIHSYKGENNTTNFSGVVGYNASEYFQGVQNCVIAGLLKTDDGREFVDYGTAGNHKNVLCGEDAVITEITKKAEASRTEADKTYLNQYSGNYAWNAYYQAKGVPTNSIVTPAYVSMQQIAYGDLCAIMNSKDDNTSSVQDGHPWRQVLGYQLDMSKVTTTGSFLGAHTEGSPAQRVPLPGYIAVKTGVDEDGNDVYTKTAYKVVKDASNNYTADWYYFDDLGDATPYPSDAASMKVKRIEYHRGKEYLQNYNSFCLPFEFTQEMKPTTDEQVDPEKASKIFIYDSTIEGNGKNNVFKFTENTTSSIAAGTPFILWTNCKADKTWIVEKADGTGTDIALNPTNPSDDGKTDGLYGQFNTTKVGQGYYKLNDYGDKFGKTGTNSVCYPYRTYLKLGSLNTSKAYTILWEEDEATLIMRVDGSNSEIPADAQYYNTLGQRVNKNTKGIVIVNGKKFYVK